VNQQVIADHLDLSQGAVSQWMERLGIDWRVVGLDEIRIAYIRELREQAAGRAAAGDLDLATERAGLARAQREKIEMQNAVVRRELAPVILIEEVLAKAGSKVAGILDAIPGMLKRRCAALTSTDIDLVSAEIARARNIAAAISLAGLNDEPATADEDPGVIEIID
jgi:terminase small subunit / prophage DNA-packing protein